MRDRLTVANTPGGGLPVLDVVVGSVAGIGHRVDPGGSGGPLLEVSLVLGTMAGVARRERSGESGTIPALFPYDSLKEGYRRERICEHACLVHG